MCTYYVTRHQIVSESGIGLTGSLSISKFILTERLIAMARITVEDCLENESNRFSLVRLAARRAKQLLSGKPPVTDTRGNKAVVSALREIADGKVRFRHEDGADVASAEGSNGADHSTDATPTTH